MESGNTQIQALNTLFNQRFFLGVYAPIILEFIVYAIYIIAKGVTPNWGIALWAVMLFAPALFLYLISPMLIYFVCGVGYYYQDKLKRNITTLFIFTDDEANLSSAQKERINEEINKKLIPSLVKNLKELYIDSYISRYRNNSKNNLLTSFETLFLFSIIWSILSLANFIGIIILHFKPINLDFITIDRIENPVNIAIFTVIFATLTILSDFVALYSIGRLRKLILATLPIVTPIDEEEYMNRNNYIKALSHFPIEPLIAGSSEKNYSKGIGKIYQKEFSEPLSEALRQYANNTVAKQQAWRIYKPILDNLEVTPEQAAVIKDRFFDSPFYEIARGVFSYEHEVVSLKTDMEYVKNRLKFWNEISEEEKATAMVFLFRSAEQLFKSLIEHLNAPIDTYSNFKIILQFLKDKDLITMFEEEAFDKIRKKRNALVHQSGRVVSITKKEIEDFLKSFENVLLKAEELIVK